MEFDCDFNFDGEHLQTASVGKPPSIAMKAACAAATTDRFGVDLRRAPTISVVPTPPKRR
jgi:hypothetical protein